MADQVHPQGRSKTDLRRGHVTQKPGAAPRASIHRRAVATTDAEQAFLFDEPGVPTAANATPRRESR